MGDVVLSRSLARPAAPCHDDDDTRIKRAYARYLLSAGARWIERSRSTSWYCTCFDSNSTASRGYIYRGMYVYTPATYLVRLRTRSCPPVSTTTTGYVRAYVGYAYVDVSTRQRHRAPLTEALTRTLLRTGRHAGLLRYSPKV
jgi:hypothetical protein